MLLTMGVSLYISRVVLEVLGIEDFGIYNVVGGIIALFGFITASMSTATSRFLTFELGKQNKIQLKKTFSTACTVHLLIAVMVLLLAETIGLWFLETQLVIPPNRIETARIVYHLSVITAFIAIFQIPYTASLISHEQINIYAWVEILNVLFKLLIVCILVHISFDKLMIYAMFIFIISVIVFFIYSIYCSQKFQECKFRIFFNKKLLIPMLSFSGWDLYGNMSVVARTQGVNILLNIFFGPVLNAANGIATQVQGAIGSFAGNILVAVRPQIVKNYAAGNIPYTIWLLNNTVKFTTILLLMLSLPLLIEMPFILNIWLKNVPEYTVSFCRLILVFNIIANISTVVMSGIHATGRIKRSSVWNGSIYLLVVPITFYSFSVGGNAIIPFILNILFVCIGCSLNIWYIKLYIPSFSIKYFIKQSLFPSFLIGGISVILPMVCHYSFSEGWVRIIIVLMITIVMFLLTGYHFALEETMKKRVNRKIQIIFDNF
jgi:O-antigen/teichoic acid export membrane protein